MLEQEGNWLDNAFEDSYENGFLQGLCLGTLEGIIIWVKYRASVEREYQRKMQQGNLTEEDIEKHENCQGIFDEELREDVLHFVEKYPRLKEEKLARRIMRETEYLHLLHL